MIRVFSYSESGGQAENEDAFDVRPHPQDRESYLCVIADGQGGRAGAAAAANAACRVCIDAALTYPAAGLLQPATWTKILEEVDRAVADDPDAGFTTVVAFCITQGTLCGASCGDSAAVLLGPNRPGDVLTARQYKNPPVGSRGASFVSFTAKLLSPWTVLAMSDGVWKYAGWENVLKIAAEARAEDIIPLTCNRARLPRSGNLQDDFTLVVLLDRIT